MTRQGVSLEEMFVSLNRNLHLFAKGTCKQHICICWDGLCCQVCVCVCARVHACIRMRCQVACFVYQTVKGCGVLGVEDSFVYFFLRLLF